MVVNGQYIFGLKNTKKNSVVITKVKPHHSNGCEPSNDQLVQTRTRAGDYTKYYAFVMQDLMKMSDVGRYVSSNTIRELITRVLPNRKPVNKRDICNVRIRMKLLIREIKASGKNPETFNYNASIRNSLTRSKDHKSEDYLETALIVAKEVFNDYLLDEGNRVKVIAMLQRLSEIDKGFTFNVSVNKDNVMTGIV